MQFNPAREENDFKVVATDFTDFTAAKLRKVPYAQLRNLAKAYGIKVELGLLKADLIQLIITASSTLWSGFRVGDSVEVVRLFQTDCDEPHTLNPGLVLVITEIDEDGDLAVNVVNDPWPENAWIMEDNFMNLKVIERKVFQSDSDHEKPNALEKCADSNPSGASFHDDQFESAIITKTLKAVKAVKPRSVLRKTAKGALYKLEIDKGVEEVLFQFFDDLIIVSMIFDFLHGDSILATKTKMFDAIYFGLTKMCGDAIPWNQFLMQVRRCSGYHWKMEDLQQIIFYLWNEERMEFLLGALPMSDKAKCTEYHAFSINKRMVRSVGSCSCYAPFGSELHFSDMTGPKRTSWNAESHYITKLKIYKPNLSPMKWTETNMEAFKF